MAEARRGWPLSRALLVGVLALALVEWIAAARAYRTTITPDDWDALRQEIAGVPADEPVLLADDWLGPRARMAIPRLARTESTAPYDLRSPAKIHVIGWSGRGWSEGLQHDLEDRPAPTLEQTQDFGALSLTTWAWPERAEVLASFVDDVVSLRASADGRACKGKRTFKCRSARAQPQVVEVDYRPRRCLEVTVDEGGSMRMTYPDMPLGTVLRGHVGWGDFNRRLRSDAPATIEIRIGDRLAARFTVSDAQGWHPIAVATAPGTADVSVDVVPATPGTWQRGGYTPRPPHPPCFELRSLAEGA